MAVHPPKHETFDVAGLTNVDPKGVPRVIDVAREHPWGLYVDRAADHAHFGRIQTWLLPGLGLRVTVFHYRPGHERDQDFYVDLGEFTAPSHPGGVWTSEDHYVDLVVRTGRDTEVLDVDELLEAHAAGLLDPGTVQRAVERTTTAVDGIATHGHDLGAWLASLGHHLSWA